MIHNALHSNDISAVFINHKRYKIKTSLKNGCRFLTWDGNTFMEQNKSKEKISKFAEMARKGNQVTWIMRTGGKRWGLIINDHIERE